MNYESIPTDSLLLAEDESGCSNAFIADFHVFAPNHVAAGGPIYRVPRSGENARIPLESVLHRDLAFSIDRVFIPGFEKIAMPEIGQELSILGLHGPQHTPFEIVVKVKEILANGRVIVTRWSGAEAQPGMSGSPAVTINKEVVGILVAGVEGKKGQELYLERIDVLR